MTTMAFREGIMAADSAAFADDTYGGQTTKIFRTADGSLVALAGSLIYAARVEAWLKGVTSKKPDYGVDVSGILVRQDGTIWVINGDGDLAPINAPYLASGSGRVAALGALAAGASAQKAVEIACGLDAYTRGPVQVEHLNPGAPG